jgi:hypothetical protein
MTGVAAIGPASRVEGLAFAGVDVHVAADATQAREAWAALRPAPALVILTPDAHTALREELATAPSILTAVLPR